MIWIGVMFAIVAFCWWVSGITMGPPRLVGAGTCEICKQLRQVDSGSHCRECWRNTFEAFL